ncbi:hypothetical protein AAG906_025594 [Vitis piasezkii]
MPNSDCKLFYPNLYLLELLRINIDENIGRPMLPSIPNENAYLNRVVKPIYDLCVEVEGSIMGTTISIEKNNGPIYACCNRSLKSAIHQVFSPHCVCIHHIFGSGLCGWLIKLGARLPLRLTGFSCCQNHCLGIGRTSSRRGEEIEDSHQGSWEFARRNRQTCAVLQVSYESGFLMIVMKFVGTLFFAMSNVGELFLFTDILFLYRFIYTGYVEIILDIAQDLLIATDQYLLQG